MLKYLVALAGMLAVSVALGRDDSPGQALQRLLAEHWQRAVEEQVFFRSDPDAFRLAGKLPELTTAAEARRQAFNESVLARLAEIDEQALTGQDRISYQVFRYEREAERESYRYPDRLFPLDRISGYHTYFADAPGKMAFTTREDYERYLASLADFPRYNREQMALLAEGVRTGYTQNCEAMAGYASTIDELIVEAPEDSSLYAPFTAMPATFTWAQQAALRERGAALIAGSVVPAYRELYAFYTDDYASHCRPEPGISSLPGGADYYAYRLRYYTTTDMSAREIHELGLEETRRIRGEMEAIIRELGFKGSFREFLDELRGNPRFYTADPQDLLEKLSFIAKRMDGMMPALFGRLARTPYTIRAAQGRGAYYASPSPDGRTPGIYYTDVSDLDAKPLYTLEALTLHEAVPGHHHQMAVALELDLPEFRRQAYHAAFGEGWGLYAERLGLEAGFYTDPYSNFGRLTYEMWRANRLVVDTGIHAFGWSRQRAIDYLLENSALSRAEVEAEVDRYITWPGQATAYKIGELKIRELRARAETALGPDFDLRAFHDVVVGNGSMPLAVLEQVVDQWIAGQAPGRTAATDRNGYAAARR